MLKVSAVTDALIEARSSEKPTFLNIRTVIGYGASKAGTADIHGAALGVEEVATLKRSLCLDPDIHFYIPQDVYDFFHDLPDRGEVYESDWRATVAEYRAEYPTQAEEFELRVAGKIPESWTKYIPSKEDHPTASTASRKSAGVVTSALAENINSFLVGTADLTPSCNVAYKNKVDFQSVSRESSLPSFAWLYSIFSITIY